MNRNAKRIFLAGNEDRNLLPAQSELARAPHLDDAAPHLGDERLTLILSFIHHLKFECPKESAIRVTSTIGSKICLSGSQFYVWRFN